MRMVKERSIIEIPTVATNRLKTVIIEWVNTFGKKRRWEAVRRVMKNETTNVDSFDNIVVVVPITDEGKIVFISQFRATVGSVLANKSMLVDESRYQVIEFPAGVVDVSGMTKLETASQELAQEAKYLAVKWRIINEGPISAGMSFEYVTTYLATRLIPNSDCSGDEQSKITVYEIFLSEARDWIEKKREEGFVIDSRIIPLVSLVKEELRGELDGKKN